MDVEMVDAAETEQKPIECLKLQPKKSILKNRVNSVEDKQAHSEEAKAHFDEMNIMATYHPADKDYGHMKIDEPKTPYHMSDNEDDGASTSGQTKRRVSLVELEKNFDEKLTHVHDTPGEDYDSEEEISEEEKKRRKEFAEKRKKHYVKEAFPIHSQLKEDDE